MRSLFGVSLFSLFVDHRACICIGDRCIDRLALGLARGAAGLIQTVSQYVTQKVTPPIFGACASWAHWMYVQTVITS